MKFSTDLFASRRILRASRTQHGLKCETLLTSYAAPSTADRRHRAPGAWLARSAAFPHRFPPRCALPAAITARALRRRTSALHVSGRPKLNRAYEKGLRGEVMDRRAFFLVIYIYTYILMI
ncbi:hypothetical protein PVAP13_6NG020400 [Panicum virgatum]|uniref:Uncharacterized protein n=1 Tax=Panicum virgatum TaxID=38727 RepID=A0A8T0QT63_PANVG|nr:hypothetical protein PVAP13_6NG020400 [Panicum virgatum]